MPRIADRHLQERILKVAQSLWRTQGEEGLTLRTVAKAAQTTTTTVYKRFRNKEALRLAIAERVNKQLIDLVTSATSLEEAIVRYLHFAETHSREYQLLYRTIWPEIFGKGQPRPGQVWVTEQLANRFGGSPGSYVNVHFALFLITHGAASLLAAAPKSPATVEARDWCVAISGTLLKNVQIFAKSAAKKVR
jgi:AcrR family transcriptional regulator